ncbi:MAG: hypothetical protein OK442_02500 [Thaumarchaeota archaeon]|nr:hypothetical protein [Nitrososphaerota archaeon]
MGQDDSAPEVMLAQEQAVIRRGPGIRKGVEAAFGMGGETEGTLVLTDRRLVYVHGSEKEESLRIGGFSAKRLFFSDVESLDSMPMDSASLEIQISVIAKVAGHHGEAIAPKLEVTWTEGGSNRATEFVQQISGASRRRNLNDWAKVIDKLRANQLKITPPPPTPESDTLEGRIMGVLGDMQEKGLLTVENEVEERYKVDLDPDVVEAACEKLVAAGLLVKGDARYEDVFYRKASPLGADDLSA